LARLCSVNTLSLRYSGLFWNLERLCSLKADVHSKRPIVAVYTVSPACLAAFCRLELLWTLLALTTFLYLTMTLFSVPFLGVSTHPFDFLFFARCSLGGIATGLHASCLHDGTPTTWASETYCGCFTISYLAPDQAGERPRASLLRQRVDRAGPAD
jgi:hypothetical protein